MKTALDKQMRSCGAIIVFGKNILLFLRDDKINILDPNCWELPGGGLEKGESPDECIKRELVEEVSYVPNRLRLLTELKIHGGSKVYIYYAFVGKNEANCFKKGKHEGQTISFFTLEEMDELKLTPILKSYYKNNRKALSKAIANKSFANFSINN